MEKAKVIVIVYMNPTEILKNREREIRFSTLNLALRYVKAHHGDKGIHSFEILN